MSCGPPVSGRVSAIKSQFENLSNFESLDISGTSSSKKPEVKFQFQRANTSVDLLKRSEKAKNVVKTWIKSDVPKQSSDSALLKNKSKLASGDKNKTQKKNKEKTEVKLSRHTSDPVKRSSIKRSPAFRVGDKQNKALLLKHSSTMPNEFNDKKLEDFLQKKCASNIDRLQQPGLTDSLKVALSQPLPTGPPPKKPPRTFGPACLQRSPIHMFEERSKNEQSVIKDKINFLENNLVINKELSRKPSPLQKSKTEFILHGSKFLDCLSCHRVPSMVYDTVDTEERRPLILHNVGKSFEPAMPGKCSEPIYMEPFGHLKDAKSNFQSIEKSESGTDAFLCYDMAHENSNKENMCSCSEGHKQKDLHYLCTAINDSIGETDSADREGNLSLGKTYNEISILLDAAFHPATSDKDKDHPSDASRCDGNLGVKSSVKLSRTLTEKRKDYVRRTAGMLETNTYGTLHRTFKSPMKTFSSNADEQGVTSAFS